MEILQFGAEQFRRQMSELLNRVGYGNDRVIVERHNTPIAVLIPFDLYQRLIEPDDAEKTRKPLPSADEFRTVATVAAEIRQTIDDAGDDYKTLVEGMQKERIRTLRENYPELYALHVESQVSDDEPVAPEPAAITGLS